MEIDDLQLWRLPVIGIITVTCAKDLDLENGLLFVDHDCDAGFRTAVYSFGYLPMLSREELRRFLLSIRELLLLVQQRNFQLAQLETGQDAPLRLLRLQCVRHDYREYVVNLEIGVVQPAGIDSEAAMVEMAATVNAFEEPRSRDPGPECRMQ